MNIHRATILADGDYPSHPTPLRYLEAEQTVVCCDGATSNYIASGGNPYAIVGDGDSLAEIFKEQYKAIIHKMDNQETNDLTKAFRFLVDRGFNSIDIVGATGKREDHTLANVALLAEYATKCTRVQMWTDHGYFTPINGSHTFTVTKGVQVSIFNINATELCADGLKYPIYPFKQWWQGTLNEAINDTFNVDSNGMVIVYITYENNV